MSRPEEDPPPTRERSQSQRAAVTQRQPMRLAQMQDKLSQEVDVTAYPPRTDHHLGSESRFSDVQQLDPPRLERQAAFDLLAGEVSHELAHTLTFLRCITEGTGAPALPFEDGQMARRQIERLQSMLRHLRRLTLPPPARELVPGLDILQQAAAAVSDLLVSKRATLIWAIPDGLQLRSDASLFKLLARDVIAAVACDADVEGTVTVQCTLPSGRESGAIEVWRSASGTELPPSSDLFDPWTAMLSPDADLGLAICHRIARVLGWELSAINESSRAGLRLTIPSASFCLEPGR